jgi:hypothetical protein
MLIGVAAGSAAPPELAAAAFPTFTSTPGPRQLYACDTLSGLLGVLNNLRESFIRYQRASSRRTGFGGIGAGGPQPSRRQQHSEQAANRRQRLEGHIEHSGKTLPRFDCNQALCARMLTSSLQPPPSFTPATRPPKPHSRPRTRTRQRSRPSCR